MNNILSGSWWWWQSVNSNLTAPTSSHVSAAAKYRLTVHNRPTAGPDPVTKKPSDSDFWCQKITKLYHHKLSTQFCQCQPVMTVSTKTKHTKATISNPNPTHSACNTLHNSTIFIKICTLVAWMELDYVLCVACGSGSDVAASAAASGVLWMSSRITNEMPTPPTIYMSTPGTAHHRTNLISALMRFVLYQLFQNSCSCIMNESKKGGSQWRKVVCNIQDNEKLKGGIVFFIF